ELFGDASYGTAENIQLAEAAGADCFFKVQVPSAVAGRFSKDDFVVDLQAQTVRCPAGHEAPIRPRKNGGGCAEFGACCKNCPLKAGCTASAKGRAITIHPHEETLQRARERQRDPARKTKYKTTRPKIERKIGQMMRRRHGGRRARVRGQVRVAHDFAWLAAATNLQRFAALRVRSSRTGWGR
ncbi:MAG: IS1182 family transposase, partial [Deltaproteobacteria bacterium]|nr:IS1182 family transposase [Deltaproteobacteria bacterium]